MPFFVLPVICFTVFGSALVDYLPRYHECLLRNNTSVSLYLPLSPAFASRREQSFVVFVFNKYHIVSALISTLVSSLFKQASISRKHRVLWQQSIPVKGRKAHETQHKRGWKTRNTSHFKFAFKWIHRGGGDTSVHISCHSQAEFVHFHTACS